MVVSNHHEHFQDPTNHILVPSPNAPRPVYLNDANDLSFPFGSIDGLDHDDLRTTAYEIFFTSCRSSLGFGGRTSITLYPNENGEHRPGSPGSPRSPHSPGVGMTVSSRTKKALGLKVLKRTRRSNSCGSNPSSPSGYINSCSPNSPRGPFSTLPSRGMKRPLTSAEIMRQQMKVSQISDSRLRKTLMKTLVGQTGQRANTIILPLELLRQLKLTEFNDSNEYHMWQKRQLKILEVGLLNHPSIPLGKTNTFAKRLRDIIHDGQFKPIDTNKNSEMMKVFCSCVISLSWRSPNGAPTDVCHWADGYPLNINLYIPLLRSIFDLKDETYVLDEVDELLELMKKTWPTLGITRPIHNLCFTWVLFEQYVMTGQVENDLLCATLTMLNEVANDAKKVERDPIFVNMLSLMLNSIKKWSENLLLDYHESLNQVSIGLMKNILPLVHKVIAIENYDKCFDFTKKVDHYIRSSSMNAFAKILDNGNSINESMTLQEESEKLIQIAKGTEELALREQKKFSSVLKKWHPISAGIAAVTLHTCYGNLLKKFIANNSTICSETLAVLQQGDKLEKLLVNMVVEDSVACKNSAKNVVREMVRYDVDSIVLRLLRQWIQESLKTTKDVVHTAKETETWNPKSKSEPYAHSALELTRQTRDAIDTFFKIPIGVSEDLVREFTNAIEDILQDYINFVASCGSKHSYVPTLPHLTRCGRDSTFIKLWRMAATPRCSVANPSEVGFEDQANYARPSTSRGTQRLYIRLNTLHYILSQLNSLEKNLAIAPRLISSTRLLPTSYFDQTRSTIKTAAKHVSEVAAYRLIFLDSNSVFYGRLYVSDVEASRIAPALKIMKHNMTLLSAIVTDRAESLATKEVMKASFDAFITILLAGGSSRSFTRHDHKMIEDDLNDLKRFFSTCGDGLIHEDVVDQEAEKVDGVVALMGKSTEELVFGLGDIEKFVVSRTNLKWDSTDPNTILRVLCYRNESGANMFVKKTFQIPKRK